MDLFPEHLDGAIVFSIESVCRSRETDCPTCRMLAIYLHNWINQAKLPYLLLDFQDEKEVCPHFLEELQFLTRRLPIPKMYVGVSDLVLNELARYVDPGEPIPVFRSAEGAIKALRLRYPGITEISPRLPVIFGNPLSGAWLELHSAERL